MYKIGDIIRTTENDTNTAIVVDMGEHCNDGRKWYRIEYLTNNPYGGGCTSNQIGGQWIECLIKKGSIGLVRKQIQPHTL